MTQQESANIALIRRYINALERFATGEALERFFAPDAKQVELPNLLNPKGGTSDLATILKRSEMASTFLKSQRYEILSEMASGARLAVEARWQGVLAVPVGEAAAGTAMTAHFAMFFELRDGYIQAQRNYDCFEPW